jgi:hypothetical protein
MAMDLASEFVAEFRFDPMCGLVERSGQGIEGLVDHRAVDDQWWT